MEMPPSTLENIRHDRFDEKKAYVPQEEDGQAFFDDGREVDLLHFIYSHPSIASFRGSPTKVLKAIDEFGQTKKYLMNVGADKGRIVSDLIAERKPKVMVELGGYVGYSALLFGDAVRKAGGQRYFSLERNPVFGAIILSLVDLAGLGDIVKIVVGSSGESIERLHAEGALKHIDLMFLDHFKPAYTTDLKLCEHLNLVIPGTVLAADNIIKPGNPPYLKYIRSSVDEKRKALTESNGIDISGFGTHTNMYKDKVGEEHLNTEVKGNPNLIYKSKLINSFEPTGVPVGN